MTEETLLDRKQCQFLGQSRSRRPRFAALVGRRVIIPTSAYVHAPSTHSFRHVSSGPGLHPCPVSNQVPGFGVDRERLAQSLGGTVEVACGASSWRVGQRRGEPDLVADLSGDGVARRRRTPLFAVWPAIAL